jgi:hypothetical protein
MCIVIVKTYVSFSDVPPDTSLVLPFLRTRPRDRLLRSVRTHGRTAKAACAQHIVLLIAPHIPIIYKFLIILYMYLYIFFELFGFDPGGWHHGASGSRRHRPARVSGRDPGGWHHGPFFGAMTTVRHAESGWSRP